MRLLIIGTQEFAVGAVRFALRHMSGLSFLGIADSGTDVAGEVRRAHPEVVVLDGLSNGMQALARLSEIRAAAEDALLLVVVDEATAAETAQARDVGAVIFTLPVGLSWTSEEREEREEPRRRQPLTIAGGTAAGRPRGSAALTSRELETLAWVAQGHPNGWIAHKLWVTEQTVKFHLTNIYRKLGVANRTEASQYAIRHGLVSFASSEAEPPRVVQSTDDVPAGAPTARG